MMSRTAGPVPRTSWYKSASLAAILGIACASRYSHGNRLALSAGMTSSGRSARALVGGRGSGPRSREHESSRSIAEHRSTSPSVVISPRGQHRLGRGTGVVAEEAGIQQQVVQLSSLLIAALTAL